MSKTFPLLSSLLLLNGCVANDEPVAVDNVARLSPNGRSFNGIDLGGVSLVGVSPSIGTPIGFADIEPPLVGAGIVGSSWTGRLTDGSAVALRIDAAQQGTGTNTDIWSYRFSVVSGNTSRPLCLDSTGAAAFAD